MSEHGDGAPPPLWYRLVLRLVVPVALVIAWHFLVISGRWPHSIIPTPWEALESLGRLMANGTIPRHATISLIRLLEGFALGSALGYVLAAAVTLFAKMRLLLGGTLAFLAPVPVIAWIPVLIVSLGIDGAKVGLITIGTASLVYAYALTGFAETRLEHLEVARLFGKSRLQTFVSIVMPSSAYAVLGEMRVALGLSWVLLIASELIASSAGLGWFIWDSRNFSRPDDMVAGMLAVALLGFTVDKCVEAIQEWLARWRPSLQGISV